jgi:hypothetical protein
LNLTSTEASETPPVLLALPTKATILCLDSL